MYFTLYGVILFFIAGQAAMSAAASDGMPHGGDAAPVTINVDFKSGYPAYRGKGVLGCVADGTWNGLGGSQINQSGLSLVDGRGRSTAITLSCSGFGGTWDSRFAFGWGDFADYWFLNTGSKSATLSFHHAPAGEVYELILYCQAVGNDRIMRAAVDGGAQQSTSGISTGAIQWVDAPDAKSNILRFTGAISANGILAISLACPGTEADIQGLQLQLGHNTLKPATRTYRCVPDLRAGYDVKVTTIGTSLTDMPYGVSWPSQVYSALFGKYQGHIILSNRAISGSNSRSGKLNIDAWLAADHPDVVFIEYAINDAVANDNITLEEVGANLDFIIGKILASNPKTDIILQTMNNCLGSALTDRPQLERYYQKYRDYAADHGYLLIDNYPLWKDLSRVDPALWSSYVPDNIHPTEAGRANVMLGHVLKTLESVPTQPGLPKTRR